MKNQDKETMEAFDNYVKDKYASEGPVKQDYTFRRKKIYKGKMAPTGYIYLVVKVKGKRSAYESNLMILGGLSPEAEKVVADYLRDGLRKKYGV